MSSKGYVGLFNKRVRKPFSFSCEEREKEETEKERRIAVVVVLLVAMVVLLVLVVVVTVVVVADGENCILYDLMCDVHVVACREWWMFAT